MFIIKEITKEEVEKLINNKILFNTQAGIVNKKDMPVGFYRTRHKRYIEGKYVDIAKKLD